MAHVATSSASPPVAPTSSPPNAAATAVAVTAPANPTRPRNRIQVSREKRPLYFFIGLAKKFLLSEEEVELSGLGLAVTTVVTVAEILKNSGHVTISKISTSLVDMHRDGRSVDPRHAGGMPKAKIQIWIRKSPDFDKLVAFVDHAKKDSGRARRAAKSQGDAPPNNAQKNHAEAAQIKRGAASAAHNPAPTATADKVTSTNANSSNNTAAASGAREHSTASAH